MSRSGDAATPSPDADGIVRRRDPGLGIIEGESYALRAGTPPPAVVREGDIDDDAPRAFLPRYATRDKDGAPSETVPALTEEMDRGDGHPMVYGFTATGNDWSAESDEMPPVRAGASKQNAGPMVAGTLDGSKPYSGDGARAAGQLVEWVEGIDDALAARLEADGALPPVAFDPQPDGPRYAAMGDAVTVTVAQWVGQRALARRDDWLEGVA